MPERMGQKWSFEMETRRPIIDPGRKSWVSLDREGLGYESDKSLAKE
jgi:hypothetical protein